MQLMLPTHSKTLATSIQVLIGNHISRYECSSGSTDKKSYC
ncbi:hypothetical protein XBFFL1_2160016 [Xenorhabdus bovienii str. feltiae Florida]|nr:hypothetical protein XBFFR1_260021 [Xenorhabdus bovienii str. feltiae France]CDG92338.1 hypothetical protein XBFFL1_2160016 [Xenorhabdus bovienii str. feltiae Florida]